MAKKAMNMIPKEIVEDIIKERVQQALREKSLEMSRLIGEFEREFAREIDLMFETGLKIVDPYCDDDTPTAAALVGINSLISQNLEKKIAAIQDRLTKEK